MASDKEKQSNLQPHHEQQELCTTRLPYRQGRKLTAVKVYTVNNESKHLLIFGVPSLNLRQETKGLFMKFGKILQFNIAKYPSEQFTETYHAVYEDIQAARIAKKMLDTKNYYGGNLHICYAPELESLEDTRQKLLLRKTQVISRLKNLKKEEANKNIELEKKIEVKVNEIDNKEKLYMGDDNKILLNKGKNNKKRKISNDKFSNSKKRLTDEFSSVIAEPKVNNIPVQTNYSSEQSDITTIANLNHSIPNNQTGNPENRNNKIKNDKNINNYEKNNLSVNIGSENINNKIKNYKNINNLEINRSLLNTELNLTNEPIPSSSGLVNTDQNFSDSIDIIDFTNTDKDILSNIKEALNYKTFGHEIIRKVPQKPVNRIKFNINKKS